MHNTVRYSTSPFSVGPTDASLLAALGRYWFLTAAQATRLLYAPASRTYAQARLKRLADHGYLQRIVLPRPTRTGSAPFVYTLARKGLRALAGWGSALNRRYRPAEVREMGYLHLRHTLALNDVLIALDLFCRRDPRVELAELRHERELKQAPVKVQLADGMPTAVIPDAWVDLRLWGRYRECYAIELDRGTSEQKAWRRKVAALLAYAAGPYQQAFGSESLTVAVVATPGEGRRDQLLRWTETELRTQGREDAAELFRFTGVPVSQTRSAAAFCDAVWLVPFGGRLQPLVELSQLAQESETSKTDETTAMTEISVISDTSYISAWEVRDA